MDYDVIVVTNSDEFNAVRELRRKVDTHLLLGWEPCGGVSISRVQYADCSKVVMAQAIIKK